MESLFGVPFERLERAHVEEFLAGAGDEGLTWEAKGDRANHRWVRPEQVYASACGFANSHLPGVLLIGVEREGRRGPWTLAGLIPPGGDEPTTWISKVIRTGLRPVPRHRISDVWDIGNGRVAVAVLVEPVNEPPAVTRDGQVFQRTSGETIAVKDPLVLARLHDGGENARTSAEGTARMWAEEAPSAIANAPFIPEPWPDRGSITVSAAACPRCNGTGSEPPKRRPGVIPSAVAGAGG